MFVWLNYYFVVVLHNDDPLFVYTSYNGTQLLRNIPAEPLDNKTNIICWWLMMTDFHKKRQLWKKECTAFTANQSLQSRCRSAESTRSGNFTGPGESCRGAWSTKCICKWLSATIYAKLLYELATPLWKILTSHDKPK